MDKHTPIINLKGIGEKTEKLFRKLHIESIGDLLEHFPSRYDTFLPPVPVAELIGGRTAAVFAKVISIPNVRKVRNLTILNCSVADDSGMLQLTFFNMPFLKNVLKSGSYFVFRGNVIQKGINVIMEQPKMYAYDEYLRLTKGLWPVYSTTKGLTSQSIQKAVKQALGQVIPEEEFYPETLVQQFGLLSRFEALERLHFPETLDSVQEARKRLVFDEFFSFIYQLRQNKSLCNQLPNDFVMIETADTVRFVEAMPFSLTKAQKKVWQEIRNDLEGPTCMNRLIQGDVGSGKTILAVLALLMCAANGYQGALMAPTEVLAMQHFETICGYTREYQLAFKPILLVGSMTAKEKREAYVRIENGKANLIIGTHALIQDKVTYQNLALVVTDEQHRFGVRQREGLAQKGTSQTGKEPHVLVMSATPIPRTLAIILYGDLHVSVINELPTGRQPIKNCVVNTSYRPKAYEFITKEVEKGRQVYIICPMVEEGELEDMENVLDYTEKLKGLLPPQIQIAYLHGKMRPAEKNRVMEEFGAHNIDVLVSTTVIEVGINVPNATVMMVENADRFGLAQLHQLRGRVGRGEHQSYCIFVNSNENEDTKKRLEILNHSNDGFHIASEDLKLRGPGDLFGIRQSGDFAFRLGDIYSDATVLQEASEAVDLVLQNQIRVTPREHEELEKYLLYETRNSVDFRSI
ncbi:MAG: ATP-dependent DNA helicase RecG [Lachnospiraceae bacterium]|nr:ATP-dependent DNA helicase RecG [Lachnospiraceae bacterium]